MPVNSLDQQSLTRRSSGMAFRRFVLGVTALGEPCERELAMADNPASLDQLQADLRHSHYAPIAVGKSRAAHGLKRAPPWLDEVEPIPECTYDPEDTKGVESQVHLPRPRYRLCPQPQDPVSGLTC